MVLLSETNFRRLFRLQYTLTLWCRSVLNPIKNKRSDVASLHLDDNDWWHIYEMIRQNTLQKILQDILIPIRTRNSVPTALKKKLDIEAFLITQRGTLQQNEFRTILTQLTKKHIRFVVMKALPYFLRMYDGNPQRVTCDLDLLIPPSEFPAIRRLLKSYRYHWTTGPTDEKTRHHTNNDFYAAREEEIFTKHQFEIELHTAIVDTQSLESQVLSDTKCRLLTEDLFAHSVMKKQGTYAIRAFAPTELVVSTFLHTFYQHNYIGLLRYYEAALCIRTHSREINWKRIISLMDTYGLTVYFYWYLLFLDLLFPSVIPEHIKRTVDMFRRRLDVVQISLFYFMLHRLFYPKKDYSDRQKKLMWAMMDRKLHRYIFAVLRQRITKILTP